MEMHDNNGQQNGKRFVGPAILVSTLLMAVLAVGLFWYLKNRVGIRISRAESAISAGRYLKAETILETLQESGLAMTEGEQEKMAELLSESQYGQAEEKLEAGDYTGAEALFTAVGTHGDAQDRVKECRYRSAEALEQAGKYEEAATAYRTVFGYGDAMERYQACRYQTAMTLQGEDSLAEAFSIYLELDGYLDAHDRAAEIAVWLTGETDPETALTLAQGYSTGDIVAMEARTSLREALPGQVLAVGFYHTVGLEADGTVVATGMNDDGQCDVTGWTGIVAVDAGAYHTVGLKADGTVVATGRNGEGQCEVTDWTDIVAVACADYGTIGLKADGTVVACGYQSWQDIADWQGISAIGAGSYLAVGLHGGTVFSTHVTGSDAQDGLLTGLVAVDANTGYVLGLKQDGTVVSTAGETGMTGCIAIVAGSTGYMAIRDDGSVQVHYFEARNALDFTDATQDGTRAVAIAMGGTHAAVLLDDGTVVTRGTDAYGECDTGAWKLQTTGNE